MKTIKFLLGSALTLFCLAGVTACGGSDSAKGLSSIKNATESDSVLYYFGQVTGQEYWRAADHDTTLQSEDARQAYLRGIRAGMNAVTSDDEQYNTGLMRGMQMAMNIIEFEKTYGVKANPKIFIESLTAALANDSAVEKDAQANFYAVLGRVSAAQEEKDRQEAATILNEYIKRTPMKQISADLYAKVLQKGDSAKLEKGQKVKIEVSATNDKGEEIGVPFPKDLEIGSRYSNDVLDKALTTMTNGEKTLFATTAFALFGQNADRLGVEPNSIVLLTISASKNGEAADKKDSNEIRPINGRSSQPIKVEPASANQPKQINANR